MDRNKLAAICKYSICRISMRGMQVAISVFQCGKSISDDEEDSSVLGKVPDATSLQPLSRCLSRELEEEARHCVTPYKHALPLSRIHCEFRDSSIDARFYIAADDAVDDDYEKGCVI